MRVPLSWLADHVEVADPPEVLAALLTSAGLKVESIERPAASLEGVVAGMVVGMKPHPNADTLTLAEVRTGDGKLQIVCGASNFKVGDLVPVALPGAKMPDGMVIEPRKFRGEASEGMLCSARELGVGEDHNGILVLGGSPALGTRVAEVLGLEDAILEIEVTPNRPDAMSMIGIAREVAALTGASLKVPQPSVAEGAVPVGELADVSVEAEQACPRYLARVMTDVSVGPSPDWVQRRLRAAGLRPVSNVVDATNYALLVTGQPLHAFDLDKLNGSKVAVRMAAAGEQIETIDGTKRVLAGGELVIADGGGPVALAGIMGGSGTEVSQSTRRILIESAFFDPAAVMRTSKSQSLRSEASARFERGADPGGVALAADLACSLIQQWAGGVAAPGSIDLYPRPAGPRRIAVRPERANLVLGTSLKGEEMAGVLARLGLEPSVSEGVIHASVPTRRPDLVAEEDLIEEVARLIGYERIPSTLPSGRNRSGGLTPHQRLLRRSKALLCGAGLREAYSSTLVGPSDLSRMGSAAGTVRVSNPISIEESILRPSLLPGLVAAVARNVARRNLSVRLFETGRCFAPSDQLLPNESLMLAAAVHGPVEGEWHTPGRETDLFDAKGTLELLFEGLRIRPSDIEYLEAGLPGLRPGRSARVQIAGEDAGVLGELSPEVEAAWDLPGRAAVFEVDLGVAFRHAREPEGGIEIPRFPAVLLDLAVSVPEEVPAADLLKTARAAAGELLEDLRLFDVYRGSQIGEGRKSVALSLAFRRPDRTLTDAEALAARDEIAAAIKAKHQGEIRS